MNSTSKAFFLVGAVVLAVALLISNPMGLLAIIGGLFGVAILFALAETIIVKVSDRNEQR